MRKVLPQSPEHWSCSILLLSFYNLVNRKVGKGGREWKNLVPFQARSLSCSSFSPRKLTRKTGTNVKEGRKEQTWIICSKTYSSPFLLIRTNETSSLLLVKSFLLLTSLFPQISPFSSLLSRSIVLTSCRVNEWTGTGSRRGISFQTQVVEMERLKLTFSLPSFHFWTL